MRIGFVGLVLTLASASAWPAAKDSLWATLDAFAPPASPGAIPWAKPLRGGPIRVLAIAPRFTRMDFHNLANRLDAEVEFVPLWSSIQVVRPDSGDDPEEIWDRVRKSFSAAPSTPEGEETKGTGPALNAPIQAIKNLVGSKGFDLFIAGNFDFNLMPGDVLQGMFDQVRQGKGLIVAHHRHAGCKALQDLLAEVAPMETTDVLTRGVLWQETPEWEGGTGFLGAGSLGKGRVVEFDYPSPPPATHCLLPGITNGMAAAMEHEDTYYALTVRAAIWASGREMPAHIRGIDVRELPKPDEEEIPVDLVGGMFAQEYQLPFQEYIVRFGEPIPKGCRVKVQLRRPGMPEATLAGTPKDSPGEGSESFSFSLPNGPGQHYLDVWLMRDDAVVDWFSQPFFYDSWPSIERLELDKPILLPHDTIGVTIDTGVNALRAMPTRALIRATDSLGRVVAEVMDVLPPDGSARRVPMPVADLMTDRVRLDVFVMPRTEGRVTFWDMFHSAHRQEFMPVRLTQPPRTVDVIAKVDASTEYNQRRQFVGLANAGIRRVYAEGTEEGLFYLAEAGLRSIAEVADYRPIEILADGPIRVPCLEAPTFRAAEAERLTAVGKALSGYGSSVYSLGDGNALTTGTENVCQSPATLEQFAEYLRRQYGTVSTLNSAWHTTYAAWTEAKPAPEEGARHFGVYAPWVDFRRFMDQSFLGAHVFAKEQLVKSDPNALAGFVAFSESSIYQGYDWQAMASTLDFLGVVPESPEVDYVRSFRKKDSLAVIDVTGESFPLQGARGAWLPWYAAVNGFNGILWPGALGSALDVSASTAIAPDGSVLAQSPEFFAEVAALNGGMSALIAGAVRFNSGVAVYVSRESTLVNTVRDGTPNAYASDAAVRHILSAMGYAFDCVSPDMAIDDGLLAYQCVILPGTRSLSLSECAALTEFVDNGGTIVADVLPGMYDEHGQARLSSPLSELFGVAVADEESGLPAAKALVDVSIGGQRMMQPIDTVLPSQSLNAGTATIGGVAGVVPVWLVRETERGRAVLLNHGFAQPQPEAVEAVSKLTGFVLSESGALPSLLIRMRKGERFDGQTALFQFGPARLAVVLAHPNADGKEQKITLNLEGSKSAYDLRTALPVVNPKRISIDLAPGAAAVYAGLPYDVTGFVIETAPKVIAGERIPIVVKVTARNAVPERHLVHVDLVPILTETPVPLAHYARDFICENGEGETYIPLAHNEKPGSYKVVARDVITGQTAECLLQVLQN
ncbi:MAG: hypothetical protein AMXMBFR84_18540 [Candidatus Hydrogenedentota bacterium]